MFDRYKRNINYLRISVTDRCNLRCSYCMPAEGIKLLKHEDILSFDEIAGFTRAAVEMGVNKVRITGGEPLVRKGILILTEMLAKIDGIEDLSMTTNGTLLKNFASGLKNAGLKRVNISLDTVDPEEYRLITRGGDLKEVLEGIDAAVIAGLNPVKINCVVSHTRNEAKAMQVGQYCESKGIEIRYIRQMDLNGGLFSTVDGGTGGDCSICNRLRLTSTGMLRPCLFDNIEIDIRKAGYREALEEALLMKPACGTKNQSGEFYNIGG